MATPTIDDNRISYGCINVPLAFDENFIQPIGIPQAASTGFDANSRERS